MLIPSGMNRKWFWIVEASAWGVFVLITAFLYDEWFIPGPHGPFHWVGMDFVPYWVGVRSMLAGQSPYDPETTRLIQITLLGGGVPAGQDPMMFVYPPLLFLPLLPLALLRLKWAISVWVGTILFFLVNYLGYISLGWGNRNPWRMIFWWFCLVIGALPFISISGTKGELGLLSMAAIFLAQKWSNGKVFRAGIFLALSLLKPNLVVIPVVSLLIWGIIERKYKFIAGFIITLAILFFASWMAVGNWIPDYMEMIQGTGGAPIIWSYTALSSPWNIVYFVLFIAIFLYALVNYFKSRSSQSWFSASILTGMAILPMRWIYDLAVGFILLADVKQPRGWNAILLVAVLSLPWMLTILPEPVRWQAMVVIVPIGWALLWITNNLLTRRGGISIHGSTEIQVL
jgi:hypothetical protein